MAVFLDRLMALVPPPEAGIRSYDWDRVYAALGTHLPDDFVELVETYGSGEFDEVLSIYEPDSPNRYLDLVRMVGVRQQGLEILWEDGDWVPETVSEQDRLIVWSGNDDGNCCFWRSTPGVAPDNWPVMVLEEGAGPAWEEFPVTATEFLYRMLSGDLYVDLFSSRVPSPDHRFEPTPPLRH